MKRMTARRPSSRRSFQSRLQHLLASPIHPDVRRDIERVTEAGGASARGLAEVLQDRQQPRALRQTASWLLSHLRPRNATPALLTVVANADDDSELRQECAHDLSHLDDKRAVPVLVQVMQTDPDPRVREAATYGLGWTWEGKDESMDPLRETLCNRDEAPLVRAQAAEALGQLWGGRAESVRLIVDDLLAALRDPSAEVRFWAAFSLSKVGDERALPALERLARTDDRVVSGWWPVKHEALMGLARMLKDRRRLAEAEATYRRVLADDLEEWPLLQIDALEDLARLLKRRRGRKAEADELERQVAELHKRHEIRTDP